MKKATVKKVGLEILSIVFAVLLALGLNHWREERTQQAAADQSLTNILVEVHQNRRSLNDDLDDFRTSLRKLEAAKAEIENGKAKSSGLSFHMPLLSSAAWDIANTTGAVGRFDLALLIELSALYDFQALYYANGTDYFRSFSSLEANKPENFNALLESNIAQLKISLNWGEQLRDEYDQLFQSYTKILQPHLPDSLLNAL